MGHPGSGRAQELMALAEAAGLPPRVVNVGEFQNHLAFTVASTFSDGEIMISHPLFPANATIMHEQFGESRYVEGALGATLLSGVNGEDADKKEAAAFFVHLGARVYAYKAMKGTAHLPAIPPLQVHSHDQKLTFSQHTVPLQRKPEVVVDYGPGLAGRFHTHQQVAGLRKRGSTYNYLGLARGMFLPSFLKHYVSIAGQQKPEAQAIVEQGLQEVSSDGIEEGTSRLLETKGNGFADIVIASGIHSAGEAALVGIERAYSLVRRGGVLLIRGPKQPPEDDLGIPIADMVNAAWTAGFRPGKTQRFEFETHSSDGRAFESMAYALRR